jgi:hypothetical protein
MKSLSLKAVGISSPGKHPTPPTSLSHLTEGTGRAVSVRHGTCSRGKTLVDKLFQHVPAYCLKCSTQLVPRLGTAEGGGCPLY